MLTLRSNCMNATQKLSILNSAIWVKSSQKQLYETQNATELDLSLLKIWVANFATQMSTQLSTQGAKQNGLELRWTPMRRRLS